MNTWHVQFKYMILTMLDILKGQQEIDQKRYNALLYMDHKNAYSTKTMQFFITIFYHSFMHSTHNEKLRTISVLQLDQRTAGETGTG